MEANIKEKIQGHVSDNPVFLYMKGTPSTPACGFSHEVILTLNKHNVKFNSFNVLEDWDVREGIKEFASWPFIPQLYVDGKFIGGRDIILALEKKGELTPILEKHAKS